ncbi:MAG: hypothetical protein HYT87_03205 [Nitrospirae bacterium]|nr:hypothetical protein [Nitrospirota bacterium]
MAAERAAKRDWIIHRNHYDHFFTPADLRRILCDRFRILSVRREKDGLWEFLHVLARLR